MNFLISEINCEKGFKEKIDEIKKQNENNKLKNEGYIYIHFRQSDSKNIKYISNYIFNNFKDDDYNYIIIVHIDENLNNIKDERIYSLPNINLDINQIFIDSLNDNK